MVHDVVQSKVLEELSCKYLKHATCNHAISSGAATDNMTDLPARVSAKVQTVCWQEVFCYIEYLKILLPLMCGNDQFSGENCRGSISQEKIKGPLRHTLQGGSRR